MKKKLKKLEKRVDAIAMEVVTLKNKGKEPLLNIDFNELSLEEKYNKLIDKFSEAFLIPVDELRSFVYKDKGKWDSTIKNHTKARETVEKLTKPTFKPVFMKCTQEQFDRMRPKLESVGCVFDAIDSFNDYQLLLNNYCGIQKNISNSNNTEGRTEVHTESEFLEACGYIEEKIEYTLENIQVDCRGLSEGQIKAMADIFNKNEYKIWNDKDALRVVVGDYTHLYYNNASGLFFIDRKQENKYEITYEKFMELFSEKPIEELHAEYKESKRNFYVGDFGLFYDDNIRMYNTVGYIGSIIKGRYTINGYSYKNFIKLSKEVEELYKNLNNNEQN